MFAGPLSAAENWHDAFFPYRLNVKTDSPVQGNVALDIGLPAVVDALRPVCIDALREETLALDKALLVDPENGVVGGFKLVATGQPIEIDGQFAQWKSGSASSPWGAKPDSVTLEEIQFEGNSFTALRATGTEVANRRAAQALKLTPGQLYLLEYWINTESTDETLSIGIENPAKRLFAQLPHSYFNKMTPTGQWVQQRVLYLADVDAAEIRIGLGFVGTAAIGDIRLTPVKWQIIAHLDRPATELDLYMVLNAGHRLTQPNESPVAADSVSKVVSAQIVSAESADLNPDGVWVDAGDGILAWTVPSYLPIRSETLPLTKPRVREGDVNPLRIDLPIGTAASVLVAVQTGTPLIRVKEATCNLPVSIKFNRLAAIPVYDGFLPKAKRVETRLDAMVDLNFELIPPDDNGIHVIAVSLRAPADSKPGIYKDNIHLVIETQDPMSKTIDIPVELRVPEVAVKPMEHFGVIFGSPHFTSEYKSRAAGFVKDNVTVAEYHGIRGEGLRDDWISRLTVPDRQEPQKAPIRDLARKYSHRMLDFDVLPQNVMLFSTYSYDVVDQGDGKAPKLENWNFTEYDKALDELVVGRDMPFLAVWHTNGAQMSSFELGNRTMYSLNPPNDEFPGMKQLPRDVFVNMVADYFETVATHLHEKGVLDRAMVVIDESDPSTFELMFAIIDAFKQRPHASKIRISHTTYKTSTYTKRLPDGRLIMDEVLDMPMPTNDEHFNHYEPEWASRMKRPTNQPWVYYVETDRLNIDNGGLSTVLPPLQLREGGVKGWYCWATAIWSMPYEDFNLMGSEYPNGPSVNPWLNPYYHHGHGLLSFFYPPDPRGPVEKPTDVIIPSYRLALIRDGITDYALLDIAEKGTDDAGRKIAVNSAKLQAAREQFGKLWPGNPTQWYLSYDTYRTGQRLLQESIQP